MQLFMFECLTIIPRARVGYEMLYNKLSYLLILIGSHL